MSTSKNYGKKNGSDHFRDILNPYGEKSNYGKIGRRRRLSKLNVFFSIILSVTIYLWFILTRGYKRGKINEKVINSASIGTGSSICNWNVIARIGKAFLRWIWNWVNLFKPTFKHIHTPKRSTQNNVYRTDYGRFNACTLVCFACMLHSFDATEKEILMDQPEIIHQERKTSPSLKKTAL